MARSEVTDYLQSFRFHVLATRAGTEDDPLAYTGVETNPSPQAGFMSCTVPEMTQDAVEYREGTSLYTKKFLGPPTFSDVSLQRGLAREDSTFFDWASNAATGGEYRADVDIIHYHRDALASQDIFPGGGIGENTRVYRCYECIPTRAKPGADLDSNTGDVSLAEVDIAIEWFEILNGSGG